MSATGRGAVRDARDFYRTPAWSVRAILPFLPTSGTIMEPGCGDGAILEALIDAGVPRSRLYAVELDPGLAADCEERTGIEVEVADFLREPMPGAGLVIGNPPFGIAQEFVEKALEIVDPTKGTVCMLLRLNWFGGGERAPFHRAAPADLYVLPRRPSFCASITCKKKCGWQISIAVDADKPKKCAACGEAVTVTTTDATEYCWAVWRPGGGGRWFVLECEPARGGR